jgi:hypothetical protein
MGAPEMLTFDPVAHEYRVGGVRVPGVTSVLWPLVDFSRVPPDVLAAKADLGRRVHLAAQLHDEDDLDEASVEADVAPYLEAYRRFLAETRATVVENECRVFDPLYRYAGTLDRVMAIDGECWLVDLKTSIATPITTGPQTSAYLRALSNPAVTRRAALRLRPDGTYRLDALNDPNDWSVFLSCLTLYRYAESLA